MESPADRALFSHTQSAAAGGCDSTPSPAFPRVSHLGRSRGKAVHSKDNAKRISSYASATWQENAGAGVEADNSQEASPPPYLGAGAQRPPETELGCFQERTSSKPPTPLRTTPEQSGGTNETGAASAGKHRKMERPGFSAAVSKRRNRLLPVSYALCPHSSVLLFLQ